VFGAESANATLGAIAARTGRAQRREAAAGRRPPAPVSAARSSALAIWLAIAPPRGLATRPMRGASTSCSSSASWPFDDQADRRLHAAQASIAPPLPDEALPAYTLIVPALSRGFGRGGTGRQPDAAGLSARPAAGADRPGGEDHETQAAFAALDLPAGFQVLIAPPGSPQTKPRACNIALERARGDLVVIYDAEDAPHPVSCVKPPRASPPSRRAWPACRRRCGSSPTRASCPTSSRSNTPCCSRCSCRPWRAGACPFPLGGTSNHFPRQRPARRRRLGSLQCHRGRRHRLSPGRPGLSAGRHHPPDLETAPTTLGSLEAAAGALDQGPSPDPGRACPRPCRPHARAAAALVLTLALPVARPICTARCSSGCSCKPIGSRSICAQRSRPSTGC
jgi:hypothetical protein